MNCWVKIALSKRYSKIRCTSLCAPRMPKIEDVEIGVFRTEDDRIFAINNSCPHKGGPLSQGIVYGDKVACPLAQLENQPRRWQSRRTRCR